MRQSLACAIMTRGALAVCFGDGLDSCVRLRERRPHIAASATDRLPAAAPTLQRACRTTQRIHRMSRGRRGLAHGIMVAITCAGDGKRLFEGPRCCSLSPVVCTSRRSPVSVGQSCELIFFVHVAGTTTNEHHDDECLRPSARGGRQAPGGGTLRVRHPGIFLGEDWGGLGEGGLGGQRVLLLLLGCRPTVRKRSAVDMSTETFGPPPALPRKRI